MITLANKRRLTDPRWRRLEVKWTPPDWRAIKRPNLIKAIDAGNIIVQKNRIFCFITIIVNPGENFQSEGFLGNVASLLHKKLWRTLKIIAEEVYINKQDIKITGELPMRIAFKPVPRKKPKSTSPHLQDFPKQGELSF